MVRIENNEQKSQTEFKEELKKEVRSEIKRGSQSKKWSGCCTCFIFFLGLILALVLFATHAVARTGFVHIPIFSAGYKAVEPSRIVEAQKNVNIDQIINQALTSGSINNIIISLQEKEITGLIHEFGIPAMREQGIDPKVLQIAVLSDNLEIFVDSIWNDKPVVMKIVLEPQIMSEKIRLEIIEVHLGNLPIHPVFIEGIANSLISNAMKDIPKAIEFKSVQMKPGTLDIGISVDSSEIKSRLEIK